MSPRLPKATCDEDTRAWIEAVATREDCSQAEIMRRAVATFREEYGADETTERVEPEDRDLREAHRRLKQLRNPNTQRVNGHDEESERANLEIAESVLAQETGTPKAAVKPRYLIPLHNAGWITIRWGRLWVHDRPRTRSRGEPTPEQLFASAGGDGDRSRIEADGGEADAE